MSILMYTTLFIGTFVLGCILGYQMAQNDVPSSTSPTIDLIPNWKELSFADKQTIDNPYGLPIPLKTIGPKGVILACVYDQNSHVVWDKYNDGSSPNRWSFAWEDFIEIFLQYEHEIRYLGDKDYHDKWDEDKRTEEELKHIFA